MEDDIRVYQPSELFFDVKQMSEEIEVFLLVKEELDFDCLDSSQVAGLPAYLHNAAENEWNVSDRARQAGKTVEVVKADMIILGFEHRDIIDWDH